MNFLNNLAIPESSEHLALLRYLLILISVFFETYSSVVLVASTAAVIIDAIGKRNPDKTLVRFARDLMDLAVPNKGVMFSLAVLPLITAIMLYAQLLHGTVLSVTSYLTAAAVFYFVGLYFLYSYKKSFHLDAVYQRFRQLAESHKSEVDNEIMSDVDEFEISVSRVRTKSGRRGVILFWIGTWIFVCISRLAFVHNLWSTSSLVTVLFSGSALLGLVSYFISAVVISSAGVIFFFFGWEGGIVKNDDEPYKRFVKRFVLPAGLAAASIEPLMIFFDIKSFPQSTVSSATFGLAGVALFVAFMLLHMFYSMLKDSRINLGSYMFAGSFLLVLIFAATDEISFSHATMAQDQFLQARYTAMLAELNPNEAAAVISGEDIYNGRCSACHRFDVKLVGPPYDQTLPNFVGKMDSLEDFIMNPRQVVPGYPPMPAQGLKPAEVKAVAEYIMGVYLKSQPAKEQTQAAKKDTTKEKI